MPALGWPAWHSGFVKGDLALLCSAAAASAPLHHARITEHEAQQGAVPAGMNGGT